MKDGSEVAQLLQRIQKEYESAERGLFGLSSGSTKHDFIRQRFENMNNVHERLQKLVGQDVANAQS